ncbi:hypothetical protein Taro_017066 [Colocasia esculenta]|uniref:Uncharacterized protein n=1 Tax=Colocasia esculenta TaxID=4460 RepID=A0A843UM58_COLES|nr:hypothetical protein [Colocasia esculenta]
MAWDRRRGDAEQGKTLTKAPDCRIPLVEHRVLLHQAGASMGTSSPSVKERERDEKIGASRRRVIKKKKTGKKEALKEEEEESPLPLLKRRPVKEEKNQKKIFPMIAPPPPPFPLLGRFHMGKGGGMGNWRGKVIGVVVCWTVPHRPESVFHLHRVKTRIPSM